jgi:FkbM family methyltransferase
MNDALNQYEKHDEVMHVSAYLYPVKKSLPDTFFYNCTTCWGWGTWKKAWHNFNPDAKSLYLKINGSKREKAFNLDGAYDYLGDLNKNAEGIMHTWAVKWYASVFLKDGFCLHPGHSLTNNIGHDNSGENCIPSNRFMWNSLIENIAIKEIPFIESKKGRKAIADFSKTDTYFIVKVFNFIKKIIPSDLKSVIKRHLISSKEQKELNKIQKIPRYRNFSSKIFGYAIFATDSASFTAMYKTIFIEKIYKFISDKKNPFIIDCGANIGLGTIYFKQLYPDAKVLAFEPDQKIFDLLQKNTSNARLTKITLINKGLWNKNGKVLFSSDGIDGGKVALNKSQGNSQIEVTRLKEYLQNETVDFLKMDIEGAETIVLKDCGDALLNVNLIFIEYHSFAGQNQSLYEIMELLSNYNFRVYVTSVSYGSISPFVAVHTYAGMDMMLNIFAYRE